MLYISQAYDCINYKILLKNLKTQESGATHYNDLNLTYAEGGNGTFLEFFEILDIGLIQG